METILCHVVFFQKSRVPETSIVHITPSNGHVISSRQGANGHAVSEQDANGHVNSKRNANGHVANEEATSDL